MTAVLVADDHELVSSALVVALGGRGLAARRVQPRHLAAEPVPPAPDGGLVLLDLDLGRDADGRVLDGARFVPALRKAGWRVLVLTGNTDEARIAPAVAAGALGWVNKAAPFEHLVATAVRAAAGHAVLDPAEHARLTALAAESAELDRRWARLTQREREVLARLVAGKRAGAIAEEFVVSVATVRAQIRSVLAKLEVGSQLEAVALARRVP